MQSHSQPPPCAQRIRGPTSFQRRRSCPLEAWGWPSGAAVAQLFHVLAAIGSPPCACWCHATTRSPVPRDLAMCSPAHAPWCRVLAATFWLCHALTRLPAPCHCALTALAQFCHVLAAIVRLLASAAPSQCRTFSPCRICHCTLAEGERRGNMLLGRHLSATAICCDPASADAAWCGAARAFP